VCRKHPHNIENHLAAGDVNMIERRKETIRHKSEMPQDIALGTLILCESLNTAKFQERYVHLVRIANSEKGKK